MKSIILVTHCESEHHINGMAGGWTDWPLTENGREQAQEIADKLKKELKEKKEYKLFSSDLKRAYQTAEYIQEALGLMITSYKSLREVNIGIGTGKSKEWLKQNELPMPKEGSRIDFRMIPQSETRRELYSRITKIMNKIEKQDTKNVIIVTHGIAARMVISWWLKLPVEVLNHAWFKCPSGSITNLDVNPLGFRQLSKLGDISHLNNIKP